MTLTFAPLQRNRGRELKHRKTLWFLSTFVLGRAMIARQPQMLQMFAVETGQMSSVETGQMSAVETRQMSSAETRRMSTGKTGRRPDVCHRLSCGRVQVMVVLHSEVDAEWFNVVSG